MINQRNQEWDFRFLELAKHISSWSKDPSTKVGAVLVSPDRRIVSCGYNGFAKGTDDNPVIYQDRERKLKRVLHAEENAILFSRGHTKGCTVYTWPFEPCSHCAAIICQAEIVRVVAPPPTSEQLERWASSFEESRSQFKEAGVILDLLEMKNEC